MSKVPPQPDNPPCRRPRARHGHDRRAPASAPEHDRRTPALPRAGAPGWAWSRRPARCRTRQPSATANASPSTTPSRSPRPHPGRGPHPRGPTELPARLPGAKHGQGKRRQQEDEEPQVEVVTRREPVRLDHPPRAHELADVRFVRSPRLGQLRKELEWQQPRTPYGFAEAGQPDRRSRHASRRLGRCPAGARSARKSTSVQGPRM